ncbi:predicted protein [Botrytis cinerea T4]|uniref:Uncharacterized protein n=1 Tax=Botryotinia fuckeliana (strain T4) TaxID=999810 RepID=G2Y9C4_BOTF4|nr:predicted protein [Botrytis cinerea T4]
MKKKNAHLFIHLPIYSPATSAPSIYTPPQNPTTPQNHQQPLQMPSKNSQKKKSTKELERQGVEPWTSSRFFRCIWEDI